MSNEERAKLNSLILIKMADEIERIRIEVLSYGVIDFGQDRIDFDDGLFSLQDDIRNYGIWLETYSE